MAQQTIGVFINTLPLLGKRAGIGHFVANLCEQLEQRGEIRLIYSHRLREEKAFPGFSAESIHKAIKTISTPLKQKLGRHYPENLAAMAYDTMMFPMVTISKIKLRKLMISGLIHIYHETRHSIIPELKGHLSHIKLVADIHDLSPITHPEWHVKEHVREVKGSLQSLMGADMLITKSSYIREEVMSLYGVEPSRIVTIPNAPAAAYRCYSESEQESFKIELDRLTNGRPFFLYTGTIEPRKNLPTLFEAFRQIKTCFPGDLLIAGGYGWQYEDIIRTPKKLGIEDRVKFLGYTPEKTLELLFNFCEAFVYPSWYEGFGMPVLEAMRCGAVPIASNTSSLPEVVEDGGLLFDPASAEDLADKLLIILENTELKKGLRSRALKLACRYNWKSIAASFVELYSNVAHQ